MNKETYVKFSDGIIVTVVGDDLDQEIIIREACLQRAQQKPGLVAEACYQLYKTLNIEPTIDAWSKE